MNGTLAAGLRKLPPALPYILHLLPPAAAWVGGARHVLWFASSVLLTTALIGLWRTGGVATRIVVSALNLIVTLANVLLAVSFLVQGVGFNLAFFAHADWETLALASVTLRPVLVGVLAYLVVTLACPMLLGRGAYSRRGELGVVAAGLVGMGLNAPAWSFGLHIGGVVADVQSALWVPKPVVQLPVLAPKPDARSLVLIFAESLEATYSRADLFGQDLTPRLTALAASAKQFADMRQVPLAAWSTGAFVAAQCARPVSANAWWRQAVQGGAARVDGATCLGDVLAARGYRTVFMTGVDIRFGGVETFHAAHGFVERLGFEALSPLAGADAHLGQNRHWLIEDETLFALARAKVHELAEEAEPFALVVTTADTHGPGFPSASCEGAEGMLAAVRCSDRLIAEFVGDVRAAHPSVAVALLTDHLAGTSFVGSELMAVLARTDERRLRFTAWAPDAAPETIDRPGTHFDVMPTLMDFLGLSAWTEHYLGASLLRFDSPWFSHDRPLSLRVTHELPAWSLRPGDEVQFEPQGPVIDLAGRRVLATSKGLHLRDAVFAIRLDGAGIVAGSRTFGDTSGDAVLHELARWAAGHAVVGVSTNQTFNAFHRSTPAVEGLSDEPAGTAFFVGTYGTERFVTGPLAEAQTVELPAAIGDDGWTPRS